MCCKVRVSLFVAAVLGDEMQIFPTDDKGPMHLSRHNGASEDTTTDRDEARKRALLVYIAPQFSVRPSFEVETVLKVSGLGVPATRDPTQNTQNPRRPLRNFEQKTSDSSTYQYRSPRRQFSAS
jgi:hypothetical protein